MNRNVTQGDRDPKLDQRLNAFLKSLTAAGDDTGEDPKLDQKLNSFLKNLKTGVEAAVRAGQDTRIRFSLEPLPGDPGYCQWKDAMKMVARLSEGIPKEFRRKLWLTLSEQYLASRRVDWVKAERFCFNEFSNPDDDELGTQIVRDLHRTGCSLFCGNDAEENQLMLKRVLLAYARWNKTIGYCQGFNMLAALILEVMDKSEPDALKVLIFLIEGILPEGYFTNNLRGLSVDMAVFRDLLKLRHPKLSKHLDELQNDSREGSSGTSYEPPLTNVFTMQWFLTLFSTCLPRDTVLRVWDLIMLEGNEVLLRTALAVWKRLEERILLVTSADEFYCLMGQLSNEMLNYSPMDTDQLIKDLVDVSPFPYGEVGELREKYTYNITPWSQGLAAAKKGLKILYSDDEENLDEDEEKIAVAATFGISAVFKTHKSPARPSKMKGDTTTHSLPMGPSGQNVDKERLSVDISALKKQYSKLRQRQKQAQIILTSAMTKQLPSLQTRATTMSSTTRSSSIASSTGSVALNHLLLGKKPLVTSKPRKGPPPGAVPPPSKPKKSSSLTHGRTARMPMAEVIETNANNPTQIACPQPKFLPSGSLQDSTQSPLERRRKTGCARKISLKSRDHHSLDMQLETRPGTTSLDLTDKSRLKVASNSNKSSSTELAASEDETENASDIEDIPQDKEPVTIEESGQTGELSEKESKKSDHESFVEDLMESLEKVNDSERTFYDYDDDGSSSLLIEKPLPSAAHSQKAIEIIKENSEILNKILRSKKTDGRRDCSSSFARRSLASSTSFGERSSNDEDSRAGYTTPASSSARSSFSHGHSFDSRSLASNRASNVTKPITFNPFPKPVIRRKNEVGKKLGLY